MNIVLNLNIRTSNPSLRKAPKRYAQPWTMPTIEIASINSVGLSLNPADFDLAIIEELTLKSHRGLFNDHLRQNKGTIVHIGNPDLKNKKDNGFFGGQIIDWGLEPNDLIIPTVHKDSLAHDRGANQQFQFRFLSVYRYDINKILEIALDRSPIKKAFLLTDYQFGPENSSIQIINTLADLWALHDNSGLTFNTLYEIYGQGSA